ncbi:cache domain-containing protein, partial [Puia sp.]|uniref:cache domain-containing protein n=1 Tax=Puia sp. TaxID=2045100 RepID=UPI002F40A14A
MQKLSVLFLSLVVLFLFFAGFYLYYVPANKANLNRYGFLVLQQLEASMQYKYKANQNLFANYVEPGASGRGNGFRRAKRWLSNFGVDSVFRSDTATHSDHLYYYFRRGADSVGVSVPIAQFMADQLGSHASDFFGSFMLLKIKGDHVVTMYKNAGLPIGTEIATDSLLKGSKGAFYPGVTDLHAGDLDYKLFYIPMSLGNQHFVLCGIKDEVEYNQSTHAVPAGFVYPIVIVFLLLWIISPLIRLSIMGPAEKVRLRDFTGYCFSLVGGSMVLTLIIIQVLLLSDGDARQDQHLQQLSTQVDASFRAELGRAYRQLSALDTLPLRPVDHGKPRDWRQGYFDVSTELADHLRQDPANSYYNFDRIDWVNDSGRQVINGSLDKDLDTLFIDVSQRKYYTDFRNNTCVTLPDIDTALVSVQPVVTWTEGAPRMVIARRSAVPGIFIVTLSTDMYSINRTILPSGFGFCLIDAEGRVQVHSDPNHSLNENFIDEVADGVSLRSAMKARQELYLPGTQLYGREYGLVVKPVQNLPYYLVTYYDKGYIQPVNMRILIFSLAGCGMVLLLSGAMWLIFFRRRWNERPLLFNVMDYLPWIVPRGSAAKIYRIGWVALLIYVVWTTLAVTLSVFYGPGNNQRVLILLLLTPLLVSVGLKTIIRMRREKITGNAPITHGEEGLLMAAEEPFEDTSRLNHLLHYCLLAEALVLAMGALPAALFTWYANNQELLQSVKKEQFLLAGSLDSRKSVLYQNVQALDNGVAPDTLFADWQYNRGIYPLFKAKLTVGRDSLPPPESAFGVASTYFQVAGWLANDYYDPEYVPVLGGGSDDGRWVWTKPKADTMRFYYAQNRQNVLQMASVMPQRYYYINDWRRGLLLLAVVIALLYGLYKLIYRVTAGMFLQKFVLG